MSHTNQPMELSRTPDQAQTAPALTEALVGIRKLEKIAEEAGVNLPPGVDWKKA